MTPSHVHIAEAHEELEHGGELLELGVRGAQREVAQGCQVGTWCRPPGGWGTAPCPRGRPYHPSRPTSPPHAPGPIPYSPPPLICSFVSGLCWLASGPLILNHTPRDVMCPSDFCNREISSKNILINDTKLHVGDS